MSLRPIIATVLATTVTVCAVAIVIANQPTSFESFWASHSAIYDVTLCRIDPNPGHVNDRTPVFSIGGTDYAVTRPPIMLAKESHIELLRLMRDNHAHPSPVHSACLLSPGIGLVFRDQNRREVGRSAVCLKCSDWMIGGQDLATVVSFWDIHNRVLAYFQAALPDHDDIQALKPRTDYQR
jgi:hypothetical protein